MFVLKEEVVQFCQRHHLKLNTDLGQHFLIDEDILSEIVAAADIEPDELIVEIGPGIGVLTRELLACDARVRAIEIDARLIPLLKDFTHKKNKSLDITQGNALAVPFPEEPYKIVANIPYHITSPLLRHAFLESTVQPTSLTLLLQREVAEKICDPEDAGMLTILVALFGKPHIVTRVPGSAFLPPPKVESAVLHIACRPKPLTDRETIDRIFTLTKVGFGQKRKMLRNTLGQLPEGMAHLEHVGIRADRRPQTLSIEEWIALAQEFSEGSSAGRQNAKDG
ncbi:MAG: 16S rRNA (adenine(1518)-N(6)/adenine(1519)-N(6))-dimethyltransferase RsmA [Candidatus Peregrinibacteria bacterium]|nr:16S rRNA (adenine(1518)-N(6)/adenine(1519)-N(6))-dimethyltransferase RsmA [Candidatus Peregrinibacteria bacterium]